MNWQQAMRELEQGSDVYRDAWGEDEYVSPEPATQAQYVADPEAWPYADEQESPFRLKRWPEGDVYTPTAEDQAATDWQLG